MLCVVCEKGEVAPRADNPLFPFCSSRCRQVDLGRWLGGAYVIPGPSVGISEQFAAFPESAPGGPGLHEEDDS